MTTRKINIPFAGFYYSIFSDAIERELEQTANHEAEKESDEYPRELAITEDEFNNILFDVTDYREAERIIAKQYVDALNDYLVLDLNLEFSEMISPREYNFRTDEIDCAISMENVHKLFAATDKTTLETVIVDRHSSRSGFISFYSNDISDWLDKPIDEWDHHELGTLLRAYMVDQGKDEDLNFALYELIDYRSGFYDAINKAIDWSKFEEMRETLRDEKRAKLEPDYVAPRKPCAHTIDMFKGV